jgi:hypothetical protein
MELFDVNDVQRMVVKGENIDVGTPSASYSTNHSFEGRSYNQQGGSGQEQFSFDICSFSVPSGGASVYIPAIGIAIATWMQYYGGDITDGTIAVTLHRQGYSTNLLSDTFNGANISDHLTSNPQTLNLAEGNYTISVGVSYEWSVDYEPPYFNEVAISVDDETSGSVLVVSNQARQIQIGANGIAIHLGNNFSAVFAQDNGSPLILLQGINSSNQAIGLKITAANGVQINRGSGWTAL